MAEVSKLGAKQLVFSQNELNNYVKLNTLTQSGIIFILFLRNLLTDFYSNVCPHETPP